MFSLVLVLSSPYNSYSYLYLYLYLYLHCGRLSELRSDEEFVYTLAEFTLRANRVVGEWRNYHRNVDTLLFGVHRCLETCVRINAAATGVVFVTGDTFLRGPFALEIFCASADFVVPIVHAAAPQAVLVDHQSGVFVTLLLHSTNPHYFRFTIFAVASHSRCPHVRTLLLPFDALILPVSSELRFGLAVATGASYSSPPVPPSSECRLLSPPLIPPTSRWPMIVKPSVTLATNAIPPMMPDRGVLSSRTSFMVLPVVTRALPTSVFLAPCRPVPGLPCFAVAAFVTGGPAARSVRVVGAV